MLKHSLMRIRTIIASRGVLGFSAPPAAVHDVMRILGNEKRRSYVTREKGGREAIRLKVGEGMHPLVHN